MILSSIFENIAAPRLAACSKCYCIKWWKRKDELRLEFPAHAQLDLKVSKVEVDHRAEPSENQTRNRILWPVKTPFRKLFYYWMGWTNGWSASHDHELEWGEFYLKWKMWHPQEAHEAWNVGHAVGLVFCNRLFLGSIPQIPLGRTIHCSAIKTVLIVWKLMCCFSMT